MALMSIVIGIDPVAFTIGSFSVRWYGILVVLAVLFICLWVWQAGKRAGITGSFILSGAPWAIVSAIVVSRLIHVVDRLDIYMSDPRAIIGFEGMTIYGAILGAMLGAWIYCRVTRVSFAPLADVAVPGVILAQAIGRIGCNINGCCYGQPTSLPWAYVYMNPNTAAPLGVAVHPTQLYELLWDLTVFALLFWVFRGHLRPKGSLFAMYLALYSIGAFGIRFLRGDTHQIFGGIHEGQIIALCMLAIAVPFLIWKTRWVSKQVEPNGESQDLNNATGGFSAGASISNGSEPKLG